MLSCRRASHLISDAMNRRLALHERILLRYHLVVCGACRLFRRHVELIHAALRSQGVVELHPAGPDSEPRLSPQARQRIQQALEPHL